MPKVLVILALVGGLQAQLLPILKAMMLCQSGRCTAEQWASLRPVPPVQPKEPPPIRSSDPVPLFPEKAEPRPEDTFFPLQKLLKNRPSAPCDAECLSARLAESRRNNEALEQRIAKLESKFSSNFARY